MRGSTLLKFAEWKELAISLKSKSVDILVVPGGSALKQWNHISKEDFALIRDFVRLGGGYLGFCAGAFLGGAKFLRLIDIDHVSSMTKHDLGGQVQCVDGSLKGDVLTMNFHNGPVYDWKVPEKVTVLAKALEVSDELRAVRSKMRGKPVIVESCYGAGTVVLCGPHPEHTEGLEDYTWNLLVKCRKRSN